MFIIFEFEPTLLFAIALQTVLDRNKCSLINWFSAANFLWCWKYELYEPVWWCWACWALFAFRFQKMCILHSVLIIMVGISGRTGTQNLGVGYLKSAEKWVEGKSNKAFLHFLPNFCSIWWFFKVERAEGTMKLWKIIKWQICQKFGKIWRIVNVELA